jgi:hypothetical protein
MIQEVGNILLLLFTLSYFASLVLFLILRPSGWLEWSTTLKQLGVALVGLNGCLVIFLGVANNQILRVVVFAFATIFCWLFTGLAWYEWARHRKDDEDSAEYVGLDTSLEEDS